MTEWRERLRNILRAKGVRQKEVAAALGLTPAAVGHWINGRREPTAKQLRKVCQMLDIPLSELLKEDAAIIDETDQIKAAYYIKNMKPAEREIALRFLETLAEKSTPRK